MTGKKRWTRVAASLAFLAALGASSGHGWAAGSLVIQEVEVGTGTITILGQGFIPSGRNHIRVFLGEPPNNDISSLCITPAPTDTTIYCVSPSALIPGDYRLVVSNKDSESYTSLSASTDRYDLTIGAVGPQGPTGATGAAGPMGATGAIGPAGATGATGAAGPAGAIGPAGAAGPVGPAGPAGSTGPIGASGLQGSQGEPGPISLPSAMSTGPGSTELPADFSILTPVRSITLPSGRYVVMATAGVFASSVLEGTSLTPPGVLCELGPTGITYDAVLVTPGIPTPIQVAVTGWNSSLSLQAVIASASAPLIVTLRCKSQTTASILNGSIIAIAVAP